ALCRTMTLDVGIKVDVIVNRLPVEALDRLKFYSKSKFVAKICIWTVYIIKK
ncbi:Hypothetical protein FKW44_003240, partial [Caligus rogercresseyi]